MRLGLLGPIAPDVPPEEAGEVLQRAGDLLLQRERVHRAIYLGADGALERIVEDWARRIVGDDPGHDATWRRAARIGAHGTAAEIDAFVETERHRLRLRALESLPARIWRTIEMVGDRIAVLIHDKAFLDEEDIFAANLLVFGKSDKPLVKRFGTRCFLSPGMIGADPASGIAVLDDAGDDIALTILGPSGDIAHSEMLVLPKGSKMSVQG